MNILVLNCGSSSVKYQFLNMTDKRVLAIGKVERVGMDDAIFEYKNADGYQTQEITPIYDHGTAIRRVLGALTDGEHGVISSPDQISAVGHRVVHGGSRSQTPSSSTMPSNGSSGSCSTSPRCTIRRT